MSKTTKEDILIVALHLFARDGYEAAVSYTHLTLPTKLEV